MKNKKILLICMLLIIPLITSACVNVKTSSGGTGSNGGVFKTGNSGTKWVNMSMFATAAGKQIGFASKDVADLEIDPSDSNAIYYGSIGGGLYFTYDGGNNWQVAKGLGNEATIRAVAIDPLSKCTIYASVANKIYKSVDCSRTWKYIYHDNDLAATIDHIEIDHYAPNNIYAVLSRGNIIKSENAGEGWFLISENKSRVQDFLIDPNDSRVLYAVTEKDIFRSINGGGDWAKIENLAKALRDFALNAKIKRLVLVKNDPKKIYLATHYGLLKSEDNANTWEKIELIPPERQAAINDMVIDPGDLDKIYYVTNTTFYKSSDSGKSWTTIKLPSTRAGWRLLIDPEKPSNIYMGMRTLKK